MAERSNEQRPIIPETGSDTTDSDNSVAPWLMFRREEEESLGVTFPTCPIGVVSTPDKGDARRGEARTRSSPEMDNKTS